ncbi:transposase [Neisseria dentiae]|uniref:Transposase n=1 Tax=Neisseria dentiae TaxID=194197 RepID=A0A1X3D2C0_9NEIS|nr:transposase [Neisseria dentiae]STZ51192.1 IS1106 transposase [Neisseria dentiae]
MLKAVLLGQWHSLSVPELERCLATRLDFYFFCGFDDITLPDRSTLYRFRN